MSAALQVLVVVLTALNWLAAPVAVIWLIVLGQWWAIGMAFLGLFSHFLLGLAMLPGIGLSALAMAMAEKRPGLLPLLGLPGLAYTAALITVWCMAVFTLIMGRATNETWIPLMLLSFAIGVGPWNYMAQQEIKGGGGEGSLIATFFMSLAFVVVMIVTAVAQSVSFRDLWLIFAGIMALETVAAALLTRTLLNQSGWGSGDRE